jgi:cell division protein FtsA
MSDLEPLVGIDVGSSAVSVVVAVDEGDDLVIQGCGQARHDAARKGVIADLEEVAEAVRAAAEEAEAMSSLPVEEAVVGIGGTPIQGARATASVPVTGRNHTVSEEDQRRALAACAHVSIPPDYRVLDIVPCGFALDGQGGLARPLGMPGRRLDASAYVLYTHRTHADTVEQAVNHAGVAVSRLVHEALAAGEAVLLPDERDLGCLLLDVGYGSSEWALFSEGGVVAIGATPVAGRVFTNDIAVVLKTTTVAAESVKRRFGGVPDSERIDGEGLEVPSLGGDGVLVYPGRFAAEIVHERLRDLLIRVHRALLEDGLDALPRAGLVLTGGSSLLEGMVELAQEIFGVRVRVGASRTLAGLTEPVSGPEWTVACGLVLSEHRRRHDQTAFRQSGQAGVLAWIRHALGEFFELGGGS